jgi:hypothetical protein
MEEGAVSVFGGRNTYLRAGQMEEMEGTGEMSL